MIRGALLELPLERFVSSSTTTDPNVPSSSFTHSPFTHPKSNKRPHSPGVPTPLSPAKRRILVQEGILPPPKPRLGSTTASVARHRFAAEYFQSLVQGPESPAMKLDFGFESKAEEGPSSRVASRVITAPQALRNEAIQAKRTRTSPRLAQRASQTNSTPKLLSRSDLSRTKSRAHVASPSPRVKTALPTMVPREMPPVPDRYSVHYPGFDVFQDTHVLLPGAFRVLNAERPPVKDQERERDAEKENLPPRRRVRKGVLADVTAVEAKKKAGVAPIIGTPQGKTVDERGAGAESPTPRRSARLCTPAKGAASLELNRRRKLMGKANQIDSDGDIVMH